jgi:flagellar protein FlaG
MQVSTVNFAADIPLPTGITNNAALKAEPQSQEAKIEVKTESSEITELRTELARHDISLKFSRDDATDQVVVQMIDDKTGDPIRQFPTEVSLSLAANFMKLQGVFIDVER